MATEPEAICSINAEADSMTEPEEEECSSVELKILQRYSWKLYEANIEPMRLVLDLVTHGFVTWMAYQRIKGMASCETQSYVIINGLLRAVARQREKFHRLLQILNEHPPLLSIVADNIKDEYQGILLADQTLQVDEHVSNLREFIFEFKKVVETANINIDDLRKFIISYHPNKECQSKVKDANDIDDIFFVLHTTFCSFFNYSILVKIAENFKLSDGFKVILTYEFENNNHQKNLASISLAEELQKENECFDYSMYQCMIILGLQTSLAEHLTILEFKEFIKRALYDYGDYLHLLKIEIATDSFVESTFCAPNEVMHSLISQAEDKTVYFKDIGVNKLIIGDTVIIDNIEDAGKNARHWEAYLEEYTDAAVNSKTLSQNPSEATIKIFCDYLSKSKTNPDTYVLVKTVILVLTYGDGFISLIPEKCLNTANVSGLFSALKCFLPHLDASLKKEVISFLINKCEPLRNVIVEGKFVTESHSCSQWLYKEGMLSLNVYQLLHDMHYMNNLTLSLLNALVLDDKPEIITFLMSKCSVSPSKLQKMATFACKEKNLIIASLFLEQMKSFTVDVVKGFSKYFDVETFKEFLQTRCNPEKKGELLNFCFCSDKIEIDKRKKFAMAILESGCIDTSKINLRDVLKYPKFLLLSDVSFLEKLVSAGVSFDSSLLHEAVKLIVDRIESYTIEPERVELICILLENGADVIGLEAAYSGSGGTVVHAATELALQAKSLHILKLVCGKTDVSKCLYDDKKMTPLHVVMKETECDEVSIEICHFLCNEKKIDPCIKDCDGLSAEDYCNDKSDKRLMILRKASSLHSYPHTVGKKVKNQKMSLKKAIPESEGLDEKEALDKTDQFHDSIALNPIKKINPSSSLDTRSTYKQSSQADKSKSTPLHIETMTYKKMERLLVNALDEGPSYFASKRPVNPTSHPTNESHDVNDIIDESEDDAEELKILNEEAKYEVFCSPRVKKFFETAQPKLVERVLCTIKKLACGQAKAKLNKKAHSKVQTMYQGNVDSAKRVLWYKTVLYCPSRHSHCKVLVIVDVIIDHKKLDKAVKNAENWIKRGREEGGVYTVDLISEGKPSCYKPVSVPSETSKEVLFMMKDEYGAVPIYSLPEYVLKMIRNSPSVSRLGLPLKLSYQEHCIVDMDPDETAIASMSYQESTILVVGRSGTGKTTCCLSRMWEEFRHYWEVLNDNDEPIIPRLTHWRQNSKIEEPSESNDELLASCMSKTEKQAVPGEDKCDHLHQVFVTKSPYLCQEVKHRFYDLVSSHHLLHKKHLELEHAALPTSFNDLQHFPLFITSRRLLMLMDSTLSNDSYFRWKNRELRDIIANSEQLFNEENIGSLDDVVEFESDSEDENENELHRGIVTDGCKSGRTMIEVTASLFQNQIWDKIASHKILKTMKIDPILVWQEIKSFIKGSILSLTSVNGYLSKEEYFKIGKSKAPNFTENREVIYTLFQEYQKYCKSPMEKGQKYFDECDLLHHLYKHRSKFSCIIHNFYIDEVQDFTEAELYLLLSLSHCPNGNFLCGDSAQSIMRGVSFRFTDVRSLFYELKCLKIYQGKVVVPDELHYLTVNYRAHAGIVNIANSVIELLGRFFKDSFDAIPKSIENVTYCDVMPTRKPLLLCHDRSPEDMLARNQFAMDEVREIDFGAHQAVIIPSKETVIPESLKNSLVFTVLEAKGLEFNDVLLFNFFSNSQVSIKSWELVSAYTCLEVEKSEKKIATKYIPVLKKFVESEHKALNAELKCLYTALTRAKRNLWIYDNFDNESESQHPMYEFFVKKGLIKEFNESDIDFTTEESTAEEWKAAGDFFMSRQLWEQAQTSYLRAQDASRLYQVHAFMEAKKCKFLNAAGYFLKAGSILNDRKVLIRAAKCFKAATFKISKDEKIHCYDEIAQFLEKLGKIKLAGEFYILAEEYDDFIRLCEERRRWNRVISQLLASKQNIRALKKAIEYGVKVTIEDFEVRNLAHKCVRYFMKNESESFVKEVITNELKDKNLVAKYLAVYKFHDDVLDFYILSDEYSKVLEYSWKHGLYDRGLEIAEIMDQDQEIKFLLCRAYAKLAGEGDVKKTVESLERAMTKFCNKNFDAQVLMLKAKFCCDISACKKAIRMFEELQNEGGVIEAVNILYSMLENPSATDVLKFSLRATRLSKVFQTRKISQTESKWILLYFELNQMQLLPDNSVLVPPCQAHWLQLQLNSTSISRENLNQKIQEHFKKCYEIWLTKISVKDAAESLSFFRKSSSSEYPYIIGDIELCATFHNFFDSKIQMHLLNILLAPFTLFNIFQNFTWQQHHLQSIQANTAILNMYKAEYKKVLNKQICQNFNSLDQCIKLWRLSLITTGSTIELRDELKNTKTVDIKFCIEADSSHIFCSWIDFPFSMTEFLSSTNNELLQKIIHSPETLASISCENLLYILIVQSISSIFFISMYEHDKTFFVPQIFSFVINNFNILVSPEFSIIESCSKESEIYRLKYRDALSLLQNILILLQNNCASCFLSHENHQVMICYFILILTLYTNILIAESKPDGFYYKNCTLLATKLQPSASEVVPFFAKKIYNKIIAVSCFKDIFNVFDELLSEAQNKTMNQIWFDGKKIEYNRILCGDIIEALKYFEPICKIKQDNISSNGDHKLEDTAKQVPVFKILVIQKSDHKHQAMKTFIKKLKEHMIINDFCKVCDRKINFEPKKEKYRELEQNSTSYDQHVKTFQHKLIRGQNEEFRERRESLEKKVKLAFKGIKQLLHSPYLLPDDDITLIKFHDQLSSIFHQANEFDHIYSRPKTTYLDLEKMESDYKSRSRHHTSEYKELFEELKKIQQGLQMVSKNIQIASQLQKHESDTGSSGLREPIEANAVVLDLLGRKMK